MDVASWLRSLGLEQYEAVFRKNEIDESVLPDLTEDHLRELGFPLGARLKILRAIAALGNHAEATSPSADAATPPTLTNLTSRARARLHPSCP
jgi:SAM domain (Sterile alpha motif)